MKYLTKSFWSFSQDSKIDQLQEPQHSHLIYRALCDTETALERNPDNTYILYGYQDALLVIPQLFSTRLLLLLYEMIKQSLY